MPDMPDAGDGLVNWVLAGVVVIVSALATVVGVLYRAAETRNGQALAKLEERVDELDEKLSKSEADRLECEKDRATIRGECNMLKARVESLEKRRA